MKTCFVIYVNDGGHIEIDSVWEDEAEAEERAEYFIENDLISDISIICRIIEAPYFKKQQNNKGDK